MSTVILSETKNPRGSVLNFYKPRPPFSVRDEIKPAFKSASVSTRCFANAQHDRLRHSE